MAYTIKIYVAAPGTPLSSGETSLPGHMYYVLDDGDGHKNSFGFAPKRSTLLGDGYIDRDDDKSYKNPYYSRTIRISEDQYQIMHAFGTDPERFGFSKYYFAPHNTCVDFVWSALNLGKLYPHATIYGEDRELTGTDGLVRPVQNVKSIQSIPDPYPGPINYEHFNKMPDQNLLDKILSQNGNALEETSLALTHQFHETHQQPITERTAAMAKAVEANALNAGMVSLSGIYYPAAAEHIMLQGFDGSGKQIEHGVKVGELINAQPLAASVASVSDSPARGGEAGKSASSGVTEKNPILAHAERLYTQTSAAVEKRYTEDKCGLEHGAKNVSMAITAEALAKGMDRIDQVLLINSAKPQDRHFLAIQGREIEPGVRINVLEAQQKPVAESLAQIHETVQSQSLNHTPNLNPSESSAKLAQNNTAQTNEESKDPAPERKGRSV